MSLDFGKLEFSVSFNPTSAFPLDARSYFESLSAAQAAAASAKEAGSTESLYYYGQTVVVVEENVATFYVIQPDNTLSLVKGAVFVDENIFEYDNIGNLILKGFNEADNNTILFKSENGIKWITPVDAYSKTETDEKIANAVVNANHLKRKIVGSVAEIEIYMAENNDADQYIFMVPTDNEYTSDKYDEYLVISIADADGVEVKYIEKVGSWEVDLTDYATKTDLENKVDKIENARLITDIEIEKLANIETYAQANIINSISTDFSIDEANNKRLTLNTLPISKINNLETLLNNKVDAIEGHTLLAPTDQLKLTALEVNESGKIEFIGDVKSVEQIKDLAKWISDNANSVVGLSEHNLNDDLYNKLNNNLVLTSVDEIELQVTSGKLSIIQVDRSKIGGLEDALNSKANQTVVDNLVNTVNDISNSLNNYVLKSTYDADIAEIRDILTWKDI